MLLDGKAGGQGKPGAKSSLRCPPQQGLTLILLHQPPPSKPPLPPWTAGHLLQFAQISQSQHFNAVLSYHHYVQLRDRHTMSSTKPRWT